MANEIKNAILLRDEFEKTVTLINASIAALVTTLAVCFVASGLLVVLMFA